MEIRSLQTSVANFLGCYRFIKAPDKCNLLKYIHILEEDVDPFSQNGKSFLTIGIKFHRSHPENERITCSGIQFVPEKIRRNMKSLRVHDETFVAAANFHFGSINDQLNVRKQKFRLKFLKDHFMLKKISNRWFKSIEKPFERSY